MIHELTDLSFDDFVQSDIPVAVDFYATWCPPCKLLSPILDEIADEFRDKIIIGKLDVDKNPQTTQKYGIMSMPTVLVFHRGQVISNFVGYRPKKDLLDLLGLGMM
jgi:thioredoxin 1